MLLQIVGITTKHNDDCRFEHTQAKEAEASTHLLTLIPLVVGVWSL